MDLTLLTLYIALGYMIGYLVSSYVHTRPIIKSDTIINPDYALKEKYKKLLDIKWMQDNTIWEYDDENRKLKKKLEAYEAKEENTRFKKTRVSTKK